MNTCTNSFADYIVQCPEGIQVNAVGDVGPYGVTKWLLVDKFGNEYEGEIVTNGAGGFLIPVNELPPGLLTPFAGSFTLRILDVDNGCKPVPILVAGYFDAIDFTVRSGTRVMDNLGCPFDVVFSGGGGSGSTNDNFTGDGVETVYPLSSVPLNENVYVGGLLYPGSEYSIDGAEITFNTPPADGAPIRISY